MAKRPGTKANRRGNRRTSLSSTDTYRVLAAGPDGTTSTFANSDKARVLATARRHLAAGATVTFQKHQQWGVYRTLWTRRPEQEHTPR